MERRRDNSTAGRVPVIARRALAALAATLALMPLVIGPVSAGDPTPDQIKAPHSPMVVKKANLYDIDASGTDIKYVMEALAKCSGTNICISPEVAGPITAHLVQLPMESILDHVSSAQGFSWRKDGDTYLLLAQNKVTTQVESQPAPPPQDELLIWRCKHIKPSSAVETIHGIFPGLKVVEGPDSATPTLANSTTNLPGALVASATTGAGQAGTGPEGNGSTLLISGSSADVVKARDALTELDKPRAQVSIKVAITEINSNASKELGIDWTYGDIALNENNDDKGIRFGKMTRGPLSFTGTISALIKNGNAKLLAEPNISVLDGECANILIGDRILFPKLIGYSQTGTPIYDKEEEQVGISLQIAAKVSSKDDMLLTVYPQVSLVTSFLKTQAGDYPQISTREARTTVAMKTGATLSIGGLIRDDDIKSVTKVPLLGNLPFIGQFFRRDTKSRDRTEIVILLSPTITSEE